MYKNNKGNTVVIVSVVVGVLVLSIGGYFGYTWYQGKLKKEKISRLEKVNNALDDVLERYNKAGQSNGSEFNENDFINYKKSVNNFKSAVQDLEKVKPEDEVKSDVKNCVEDGNGIAKNIDVVINLGDKKLSGKQITQTDVENAQGALRNFDEYNNLKSCKDAKEKVEDLISELEK